MTIHRRFATVFFTFITATVVASGFALSEPANADVTQSSHSNGATASAQVVLNQTLDQNGLPMTSEPVTGWPDILTKSAVVMDMSTGTLVYAKDPLLQRFPASITKILTAAIALHAGHLDDPIAASKLATQQDGNRVYLEQGEVESLDQLLYGLLLNSGNDAAVAIAEHYGGDIHRFSDMMNQTAHDMGATHSHFSNPNGLPDPHHYTTAYDMAVITRHAMENPEFRKIVGTKYYDWHGEKWSSRLVNLNHMLFQYPGAIGVKTGYTLVAHETLVVAAQRGGTTFLAVLMDAPLDRQIRDDATKLLDFSFAHYQTTKLLNAGEAVGKETDALGHVVPLVSGANVLATEAVGEVLHPQFDLIPSTMHESAPTGSSAGHLAFSPDQHPSGTAPVVFGAPYVVQNPSTGAGIRWTVLGGILLLPAACALVCRGIIRRRARGAVVDS